MGVRVLKGNTFQAVHTLSQSIHLQSQNSYIDPSSANDDWGRSSDRTFSSTPIMLSLGRSFFSSVVASAMDAANFPSRVRRSCTGYKLSGLGIMQNEMQGR